MKMAAGSTVKLCYGEKSRAKKTEEAYELPGKMVQWDFYVQTETGDLECPMSGWKQM